MAPQVSGVCAHTTAGCNSQVFSGGLLSTTDGRRLRGYNSNTPTKGGELLLFFTHYDRHPSFHKLLSFIRSPRTTSINTKIDHDTLRDPTPVRKRILPFLQNQSPHNNSACVCGPFCLTALQVVVAFRCSLSSIVTCKPTHTDAKHTRSRVGRTMNKGAHPSA